MIRRFLRENEENKRTFVRPGSVAKEILVKDEENIVLFFALLFVVRSDWFIQKCVSSLKNTREMSMF